MPARAFLFRLRVQELPISEKGFGLCVTMTTREDYEAPEQYRARVTRNGHKNGTVYKNLASQIRYLLPTLTAQKISGTTRKDFSDSLPEIIGSKNGFLLQPDFAEWLMGYPPGWTDIEEKG